MLKIVALITFIAVYVLFLLLPSYWRAAIAAVAALFIAPWNEALGAVN